MIMASSFTTLFLLMLLSAAAPSQRVVYAFSPATATSSLFVHGRMHHQPNVLMQLKLAGEGISTSPSQIESSCEDSAVAMPCRRAIVAATSMLLASIPSSQSSAPASAPDDRTFFSGTATLQAGLSVDDIGPNAALYVTARPNRPDNVPRAILDGSRGKPPPVLSARFVRPTFPFEFTLTSQNFTPEGASVVEGATGADGEVWWEGEDLIVSARLDSDGVAATRDPTDLVGRGLYSATALGEVSSVSIELQGRGLFGKSVTTRK